MAQWFSHNSTRYEQSKKFESQSFIFSNEAKQGRERERERARECVLDEEGNQDTGYDCDPHLV